MRESRTEDPQPETELQPETDLPAEVEAQPEAELETESELPVELEEDDSAAQNGNMDFGELLEEYTMERPKRGQILDGRIIRVDEDAVLVDVGAKRDAVVPRTDLNRLDEEKLEGLSSGDQVNVYVIRTPVGDEELLVSINKGLMHEEWKRAEKCMESGEVLELEVIDRNRGGLLVEFGTLRGFVPNSHIPELRRFGSRQQIDARKEEKIGSTMLLKVIEVNSERRRLILSARAAQKERRQRRLEELEVGEVVEGHVVNLVNFGAFVNLGGVDGLLHKSEIDWKRVDDPSEVLNRGDKVEVKIKDIDVERERISLSRKALLANPWDTVTERYTEGQLIEGTVTNVQDYGAFVQVEEGVEGLVHVSEMNIAESGSPRDVVQPGDTVLVRILDIQPEEGRMGLSMRKVTQEEQLAWMVEQWEGDEEGEAPMEAMEAAVDVAESETMATEEEAEISEEVEPAEAEVVAEAEDAPEAEDVPVTEEADSEAEETQPPAAAVEEATLEPLAEAEEPEVAAAVEMEDEQEEPAEQEETEEPAAVAVEMDDHPDTPGEEDEAEEREEPEASP